VVKPCSRPWSRVTVIQSERLLVQRLALVSRAWELSPRQGEVLEALMRGKSNRQIAGEKRCAPRTVEVHVSELLRRSRAHSRLELVSKVWLGE